MALIDLSQIATVEELQKLSSDIDVEIARRREAERHELLLQIEQAAKRYGVDVNEFLGHSGKTSRAKTGYQNPDNPKQHWSGKGKKPGWLQEKLDAGATLEEMRAK